MMQRISDTLWVRAQISEEERMELKRIAKSKGMTFQGYLGQLLKGELTKESLKTAEVSYGKD